MGIKDDVKAAITTFETQIPALKGKAQDVSVKNLGNGDKKKLSAIMKKAGIKILFEQVSGSTSIYGVPITKANVFHCFK